VAASGVDAVISFELPAGVGLADLPPVGTSTPRTKGNQVGISSADPTADLHALTGWALARGVPLVGLSTNRPSLEDVYLDLTASR
jgi:ABC-2 type transport system ATP-binding protein